MLLHFAHALRRAAAPTARRELRVRHAAHARSRALLRQRDPDVAVARVSAGAGLVGRHAHHRPACTEFNQRLGAPRAAQPRHGAADHRRPRARRHRARSPLEAERLHKSCRRLLWLNPLLRFDGFEPRAGGIRAMLPHVDGCCRRTTSTASNSSRRLLADSSASNVAKNLLTPCNSPASKRFPSPRTTPGQALNDTELLQRSIPGCESIIAERRQPVRRGDDRRGRPGEGEVQGQAEADRPEAADVVHDALRRPGRRRPVTARASAQVRLEPRGRAKRVLHYTATASVGGKIAQIGSRLVDMAAQKMAGDFFAELRRAVAAAAWRRRRGRACGRAEPRAAGAPRRVAQSGWSAPEPRAIAGAAGPARTAD